MSLFNAIFGDNITGNVVINGNSYKGNNVNIQGDKIIIDGVVVGSEESKVITVQINGDCFSVQTSSGKVNISGSVGNNVTTVSGDVICTNVAGNVKTVSGDVRCGDIGGDVKTVSGGVK